MWRSCGILCTWKLFVCNILGILYPTSVQGGWGAQGRPRYSPRAESSLWSPILRPAMPPMGHRLVCHMQHTGPSPTHCMQCMELILYRLYTAQGLELACMLHIGLVSGVLHVAPMLDGPAHWIWGWSRLSLQTSPTCQMSMQSQGQCALHQTSPVHWIWVGLVCGAWSALQTWMSLTPPELDDLCRLCFYNEKNSVVENTSLNKFAMLHMYTD